jgi:hypothetical protein
MVNFGGSQNLHCHVVEDKEEEGGFSKDQAHRDADKQYAHRIKLPVEKVRIKHGKAVRTFITI